jgi:hypothetical protein
MREAIEDSLKRFLCFQRVPRRVTRKFRKLKHNADILPKIQSQLETVLAAYGKFEPLVYDCQGIKDDGSDITIRFDPESKDPELICFQVKSFDDLSKAQALSAVITDALVRYEYDDEQLIAYMFDVMGVRD